METYPKMFPYVGWFVVGFVVFLFVLVGLLVIVSVSARVSCLQISDFCFLSCHS